MLDSHLVTQRRHRVHSPTCLCTLINEVCSKQEYKRSSVAFNAPALARASVPHERSRGERSDASERSNADRQDVELNAHDDYKSSPSPKSDTAFAGESSLLQ